MDVLRLVSMANDIATFFASEPDREASIAGIANHLGKFWDPRMRSQLIAYLGTDGKELSELARAGVERLAAG